MGALCDVLHQAPEWREAGEQLLRTMDKFKFADRWDQRLVHTGGIKFHKLARPAVHALILGRAITGIPAF